jgi:RNA polymerase sigma-70 factor (sigma-E family)
VRLPSLSEVLGTAVHNRGGGRVQDDVTFDEFAVARLPSLLRYAVVLTGERELAQDVVQEVLARAFVKWKRISAADSPEAYVRRMIANEYTSWRRKWSVRNIHAAGEHLVALGDARGATGDHAHDVAETDDLWQRLGTLGPKQRAVLVLRYYEQLDDEAIADILNCSASTVRSQASKALKTLRVSEQPIRELAGDRS